MSNMWNNVNINKYTNSDYKNKRSTKSIGFPLLHISSVCNVIIYQAKLTHVLRFYLMMY